MRVSRESRWNRRRMAAVELDASPVGWYARPERLPHPCGQRPRNPPEGSRRSLGLRPRSLRAIDVDQVCRKEAGFTPAGVLESACLERRRKGIVLERTRYVVDGSAAIFRL